MKLVLFFNEPLVQDPDAQFAVFRLYGTEFQTATATLRRTAQRVVFRAAAGRCPANKGEYVSLSGFYEPGFNQIYQVCSTPRDFKIGGFQVSLTAMRPDYLPPIGTEADTQNGPYPEIDELPDGRVMEVRHSYFIRMRTHPFGSPDVLPLLNEKGAPIRGNVGGQSMVSTDLMPGQGGPIVIKAIGLRKAAAVQVEANLSANLNAAIHVNAPQEMCYT